MKLLCLNTWGGVQGRHFFDYIKANAGSTDIFCFQEVFSSPAASPEISHGAHMHQLEELGDELPGFTALYEPRSSGYDFEGPVDFATTQGLAVFVKNHIAIKNYETLTLAAHNPQFHTFDEGTPKAQVLHLAAKAGEFTVINTHGMSIPGDKQDTPQRIGQFEKIKIAWQGLSEKNKILCGDMNVYPETQSIKILQSCGRDLIRDYKIQNTRNEISWKKYNNKQYFSDYVFVSEYIKVKIFGVPYNEISDHLPMVLDFSL
jgi:endonuclease/exonuclease/phosphatase family metal-dependent hydrolase